MGGVQKGGLDNMSNIAALGVAVVAAGGTTYLMYRMFFGPPPPPGPEPVKVSALTFAYPWPPVPGVPMQVRCYRPTEVAGFAETPTEWYPMIYEVTHDEFVQFPRELNPDKGPDSYNYLDWPHDFYTQFRGYYRPNGTADIMPFKVTSDWVDFTITPYYSGRTMALDVGWGSLFACSGWGTISLRKWRLTVTAMADSIDAAVEVTVDSTSLITPGEIELDPGTYALTVPEEIIVGGETYYYSGYEEA